MSDRERNRTHWRRMALASYATRHPFITPAFYAQGEELDRLERRPVLTEIEAARRALLRVARAGGAIADPGETWEAELAAAGYLPARVVVAEAAE